MTFKLYLFQFLGFVIQIVPIAVLLFVPFHQADFRRGISKKLCIIIITIAVMCCGIFFALHIGRQYDLLQPIQMQLHADTIFSACAIMVILFYFYIIKRNWLQKILILVINIYYAAIIFSASNIADEKIKIYLNITSDIVPYLGGYSILAFAVVTALTFPVMYHMMHQFYKGLWFMEKHVVWRSGIFVIIEVVFLILFAYSSISSSDSNYLRNLICYTCANLFAMLMFFDSMQALHERKQAEDMLHMLELEYHAIDNNIHEMRKFNHDMHHHFNVISTLNAEGKSQELNHYLEKYTTVYENLENNKICNYGLVDTILKYYMERCRRECIQVDMDVALNEDLGFDFMDMTVLLGNCLENAIEANMLLEQHKRFIHIQMMKMKRAVLIMVENNCRFHKAVQDGEFVPMEPLYTVKDDKLHGFGIKNILGIAQKYDGSVEYRQAENMFSIRIVLYIQ